MWELDHKESWSPKNWCFWTVVLEKTFESPLDCKEIKPTNPKGNQSWIFIGRTATEAETSILWPTDGKNCLTGIDPNAGKDWRQEEKGTREDEMVRWHHWLNGYESEQALGVFDGQGGLACCSPGGHKESNTTEWLNWTDDVYVYKIILSAVGRMNGKKQGLGGRDQLGEHEVIQVRDDCPTTTSGKWNREVGRLGMHGAGISSSICWWVICGEWKKEKSKKWLQGFLPEQLTR